MVALVLLIGTWQAHVQVPARDSRAAFFKALAQVGPGWTKPQVEQLLGPPDDTDGFDDPGHEVEFWCYGTHGHGSLPTLGRVYFANSEAGVQTGTYGLQRGGLSETNLVPDAEMERALAAMGPKHSEFYQPWVDPLQLLRVANLLIGEGREVAIAILKEYDRLADRRYEQGEWPYWVCRLAFTPRSKDEGIPLPYDQPKARMIDRRASSCCSCARLTKPNQTNLTTTVATASSSP